MPTDPAWLVGGKRNHQKDYSPKKQAASPQRGNKNNQRKQNSVKKYPKQGTSDIIPSHNSKQQSRPYSSQRRSYGSNVIAKTYSITRTTTLPAKKTQMTKRNKETTPIIQT
jgi:hypothetical protein